jgi:hypothetical protein
MSIHVIVRRKLRLDIRNRNETDTVVLKPDFASGHGPQIISAASCPIPDLIRGLLRLPISFLPGPISKKITFLADVKQPTSRSQRGCPGVRHASPKIALISRQRYAQARTNRTRKALKTYPVVYP